MAESPPQAPWYTWDPAARDQIALGYDTVPIETLGLSNRAYHALRRGRLYCTVGDLIRATTSIVSTRNLGVKSLAEIDAALAPLLCQVPAADPQASEQSEREHLPAVEVCRASWRSIDQQVAMERAGSLDTVPIRGLGLPPEVDDLLTDGMGYRTVGDVLRQLPTVRLWVERFAPAHETEFLQRLAATVIEQGVELAGQDNPAAAVLTDTVLQPNVANEPLELLVLPAADLRECLLRGANTLADVANKEGIPDSARDLLALALQTLEAGESVRWDTFWQTRGLEVIDGSPLGAEVVPGQLASAALVLDTISKALYRRNPQMWAVLERRLGLGGLTTTLQEIASGLGITRERVRQIETSALQAIAQTVVRPVPTSGCVAPPSVIRFSARLRKALEDFGGWMTQTEAEGAVLDEAAATAPDNAAAVTVILTVLGCKQHSAEDVSLSPVWVSHTAKRLMPDALSSIRRWAASELIRPQAERELRATLQARWPDLSAAAVHRILESSSALECRPDGHWQTTDAMLKRPAQRAERLLQEADRPLHLSIIVEQMSARWTLGRHSNLQRNIAAALGRDERFTALRRSGCWALAEWPDAERRPCLADDASRKRRRRRQAAVELTAEETACVKILGTLPEWQRHDYWNDAVAEEYFSGQYSQRPVYLDLEPQALLKMAAHVGATAVHPSDDLVESVKGTLHLRPGERSTFSDHRLRVRHWHLSDRHEPPPCLALLAVLSLVAEGMHGDEDHAAHNYYDRLCETLGLDHDDSSATSRLRKDFARDIHAFWDALNLWLNESDGARGFPTAMAFDRRVHVGLPISQALLREADRDRLVHLFSWHRLQPHQAVSYQDMERLLAEWLQKCRPGGAIERLWAPATRQQLVTTAVLELECWNGAGPDAQTGEADLRLHAQIRRLPIPSLELWLSARARQGMTEGEYELDTRKSSDEANSAVRGQLSFEAGDGTWLDLVAGDVSYPDLLFAHIRLVSQNSSVGMERMPKRVVVIEWDSSLQRYIEVDRVQLGQECLLLVQETLSEAVIEILETVARQGYEHWTDEQLRGLPQGWQAYSRVQIIGIAETDDVDLAPLVPIGWMAITLGGGLPLPGGPVWLTSRPPEIELTSLVGREVNAEIQTRELGSDRAAKISSLGTHLGTSVFTLEDDGLVDGDYTVVLRRGGANGGALATRSFRLRSASNPRILADGESLWVGRDVGPADGWFGVGAVELPSPPQHSVQGSLVAGIDDPGPPSGKHLSPPRSLSRGSSHSEAEHEPAVVQPSTMRGEAPAGCLVGRAAHYWVLEPGVPGKQSGSGGRCKHCGLERWFPVRPKKEVAGRSRAESAGSSRRNRSQRSLSVPAITPVARADIDEILDALIYLGRGSWSTFKRTASFASDEPWFAFDLARELEGLGHIEVTRDRLSLMPARWAVVPTTLAMLPANGGAVLCGFRSAEILDALDDAVAALGIRLDTHSAAGSPTAYRVPGVDVGAALQVARSVFQATAVNVHVAADAARRLLDVAPTLAMIAAALPDRYVPTDSAVSSFDLIQLRWRSAADVASVGAYQVRDHRYWYGYVGPQLANTGRCQIADSHLVKWLAAADNGTPLMAHDPVSEVLICPLGAQMPPLHERAAVLCSGLPPTRRKDGTVTYEGVPPSMAAQLWAQLGPSQGTR